MLALALAPLRPFGIRAVVVSTMQAVSGAGYPGVPSLDILGNVVPFIGGEEDKMQTEPQKILGADGGRTPHPMIVSAHTNRVPVIDGHTMTVSVDLTARPSIDEVTQALREFRGAPQELGLPTAPQPPIVVMDEPNRPQPRLDADLGGGMAVSVGRVRACPVLHTRFVALGHNTVRGAAGAAILNAELMHARAGWTEAKAPGPKPQASPRLKPQASQDIQDSRSPMVVMKFGGTSVADRAAIERLMAIVRAQRQAGAQQEGGDARGPIVVVSALSGVTDRLLGVAAQAGAGDTEGARSSLRELHQRHLTVAEVVADPGLRTQTVEELAREFAELERIVGALSVLREVSPRWMDTIAAAGEILSSRIVAAPSTPTRCRRAGWMRGGR